MPVFESNDPNIANNLNIILSEMMTYGLNVANIAIWGKGDETHIPPYTNAQAWDNMRVLIDGQLHPLSDPENDLLMVITAETSGLSVADRGHLLILRPSPVGETDLLAIGDPSCTGAPGPCPISGAGTVNDGSGDYPAAAIQYLRAQHPTALLGYAHMAWVPEYTVDAPDQPPGGLWELDKLPPQYIP